MHGDISAEQVIYKNMAAMIMRTVWKLARDGASSSRAFIHFLLEREIERERD